VRRRSPSRPVGFRSPLTRAVGAGVALAVLAIGASCARDGGGPRFAAPASRAFDAAAWRADLDRWVKEREDGLRKPDGWLSLVGLFWLKDGENTFGSDAASDLVFPSPAPARAGVFVASGPSVRVSADPGAGVTNAGAPVSELVLTTDAAGEPTMLELGPLLFYAIDRGGRIGIRLKNRESPLIASFAGIERYPADPAWRLEARFERYDPPKTILVPNIIGPDLPDTCPGRLVFELGGVTRTLEPTGKPGEELFIVFGDPTNGKETYGGGRFLDADWPGENGVAILDFNRAYNPPCVFTGWATCPRPPAQNKLAVAVTAGEKAYRGEAAHPAAP
jgi:uncharacterized protein